VDGEGRVNHLPLCFEKGGNVNVATVTRYTVLVVSAAAILLGVLVIIGWLVPRYFPEQFRVVVGVVIVLYGTYRFVVTYFQRNGRRGT
jgi:hypothetical protein